MSNNLQRLNAELTKDIDKLMPGDIIYLSSEEVPTPPAKVLNITHAYIWTGIKATNDTGHFSLSNLASNVADIHKPKVQEDIKTLQENDSCSMVGRRY